MGAASNAKSGRRRWSETRSGRGFLFFAIVWSIAGAFLVLQGGVAALLHQAVSFGLVSTDLTFNKQLREEAARRCTVTEVARADDRAATDAVTVQRTRHAAFEMGTGFGMAAGAAFIGPGAWSARTAPLLQEVRSHAMALGVPAPELPQVRHMAAALGEFVDALEADRQCTSARLASRYTPGHGDVYKFGVVVGYAALYCIGGGCGAHGTAIRHYGQAAGLPQHLWLPLAQGSLAGVPGVNAREKVSRVLAALDEHIGAGR